MWSPWVFDQIHNLFPQAKITSGYRGPNNPLTRRNPNSAHTHGSPDDPGAVDVAPIPGIGFDQYVSKLKAAGVPVTKALDEQAHPVAWSTGPNWHVSLATGGNKQMPVSPVLDPKKRAAMFNVNIPPADAAPQPFNIQQALQGIGSSLPDGSPISGALADNAATEPPKKKGPLGISRDQWGAALAALADYFNGQNGVKTDMFGSMMDNQKAEADRGFDREKLNAMIQAKREAALSPKPPTQTDRYVQEVLDPNTDPRRAALLRSILVHPLAIPTYGQDGSMTTNYYSPDQMGGGDDSDWEDVN